VTDAVATRVLAAVVTLQLVAETALTPYWPQLLAELFDTGELGATGAYLTACRLAGLAALPLWALAARRWPLPRLLVVALLGCALLDLAVALAPSLLLFTVASAGVVATGSALVLAYPALVAVADRSGRGDRLGAVLVGVAVFHAASLLATAIGAGIVALPSPRLGLAAFAVVDLLLALLVARRVATAPATTAVPSTAAVPVAARPLPVRGPRSTLAVPVGVVLLLAVLSDTATSVPRPFFTALVLEGGGSLPLAALLFLLPSVGALVVLPVARRLQTRCGDGLLPLAAGLAAAGLAVQAIAPAAVPLVCASRPGAAGRGARPAGVRHGRHRRVRLRPGRDSAVRRAARCAAARHRRRHDRPRPAAGRRRRTVRGHGAGGRLHTNHRSPYVPRP
jgi:MFS family permease